MKTSFAIRFALTVSLSFATVSGWAATPHPRAEAAAALALINDGTWVGTVDPQNNPNTPAGPLGLLNNQPSILISRPEYSMSWNSSTRVINWVSWLLKDGDVGKTNRSGFKRDDQLHSFLVDRGLEAVDSREYQQSCFDRGHQVPSADRTGNFKQNQAVFKMSNMMPQTAFLNRIIWERLEAYSREFQKSKTKDRLWIIAGPIFQGPVRYIGWDENIAVPTANFKIVIDLGAGDSTIPSVLASVIMPNVTSKGTDPFEDKKTACYEEQNLPSLEIDWKKYSVTLDEIEEQSGIDLSAVRSKLGQTAP